ncbi:hypothetical protein M501DRAFT_410103 [Patellaria atrata CBS 101060]|uniref:RRM domain-containing protein n=1 Tax=Patellaria atrata CBS 101060 TaxID=1346257 RepID=A0A9P4SIE0_9PEZI|nr:hypothetical protein M501DRAFT_410103 [Patellaria atrata CBS 101060]
MSGKLDKSLDDIVSSRRARRQRSRRAGADGKTQVSITTPIGGVRKSLKNSKSGAKASVPTGPAASGDSKIIVSNLPTDVSETQIKDYFSKTIGPVKKVLLTYGPNGQSRGVSTIIFAKATLAAEAAKTLDGVKVDGRPMKIEVILSAKDAPAPQAPKTLAERIQAPKKDKAQPKPATVTKSTGKTRGKSKATRGRNTGRGKPKTAEELDAEMQDYFVDTTGDPNTGMATDNSGGNIQGTNGGDTGMEDEII